jgi:hypothetical protein
MEANIKNVAIQALEKLQEDEAAEVLDFINYLQWRKTEIEQSWFWTDEWQKRYRESKKDLSEGRFKNFEDVEELIIELKK